MTRNFPPGDIRVSDADRDAAIAELSEHFQVGRLTHDEFEERSGLALRARTGNDLSELFTDLPPTAAAAQPSSATQPPGAPHPDPSPDPLRAPAPLPSQATVRRHHSLARTVLAVVIAGLVISGLAGVTGHVAADGGVHHSSVSWLVPVIVVFVLLRIIRRTRL
jgi:hypothetical protein